MSPFRDAPQLKCPACHSFLLQGEEAAACGGGCGEWMSRQQVELFLPMADLLEPPRTPVRWWHNKLMSCPACTQPLVASGPEELRYYICGRDGVWFQKADRQRLVTTFAKKIAFHTAEKADQRAREAHRTAEATWREARQAELVAMLRSLPYGGAERLAAYLVDLEARLDRKS